jgi:hypoxanthine phosphoribosyltransferase
MKIHNKEFELFIPRDRIDSKVIEIGFRINRDYADKKPLFVVVLNGAFMFAADLMKVVNIESELTFVKIASYQGTSSTGKVKEVIGLTENITGRHLIIIEDIVDTGITMEHLLNSLQALNPESIEIATFLLKPKSLQKRVNLKYIGFEIPSDFVIGYGLDFDGYGRNFSDVYVLSQDLKK